MGNTPKLNPTINFRGFDSDGFHYAAKPFRMISEGSPLEKLAWGTAITTVVIGVGYAVYKYGMPIYENLIEKID